MQPTVRSVKAEYRTDSPYVGASRPRLSWKTGSAAPGWTQAAAEIEWRRGDAAAVARVEGPESVFTAWPFESLLPRERGHVRVRVEGADGGASDWSAPLEIRAGFLGEGEWRAKFLTAPEPAGIGQPVLLRREFQVRQGLRAATLYSTARGLFQVEIGGVAVDDERFKPGWTAYKSRLVHETNDVTALLAEGPNALGASLAGGWYTERFGFHGDDEPFYGTHPSFAAQLVLEYDDGGTEVIATGDGGWRATADGPITASGIYAGEHCDARRAMPGWSSPGFDDRAWLDARTDTAKAIAPVPRTAPPVRATEELPVAAVITTPSGRTVLDFGQNLVGHLRIRVSGRAGDTVVLRHAEVLEHGELGVRPLRQGHRPVHARGRRRRDLAAGVHLPRVPVRRSPGLAGRVRPRRRHRRRRPLGHGPHRLVRLLAPAAQPPARERRVGHEGQLPVDPDRLPAARRAARLDRRHPGLLPHGLLPVRRRRLPRLVARGPRARAGGDRRRPVHRAERARMGRDPGRGLG